MRLLLGRDYSQCACHVLHTSLMLLLACYTVLVMTETNTVWYGKTQQDSYLCKQNRNIWNLEIWAVEIFVQYASEVVGLLALCLRCSSTAGYSNAGTIEKHHEERHGERRSAVPPSVWQAAPQRECQPTPEATQLQQDIQDLSTHFTPIIHEEQAFSSTWRSHQSCMIFTRLPWTAFACEVQSCSLLPTLISIKARCWLAAAQFYQMCKVDTEC